MEEELDIKSSLLAQPKKDLLSLSNAQLGFMNLFAIPLFQGVANIMPAMRYTVDELDLNKGLFEQKVREEKAKQTPARELSLRRGSHDSTALRQSQSDLTAAEKNFAFMESTLNETRDGKRATDGAVEEIASSSDQHAEEALPRSVQIGTVFSFDAVRELADSDPFNCRGSKASTHFVRQRCSETTDGSASGAFTGDWQSQATTATNGKMALSPSTQGTSIVSKESMERVLSGPRLEIHTRPPSNSSLDSPGTILHDGSGCGGSADDGSSQQGDTLGRAEGKTLKKKPSRFRMKDFPFFRRHKVSNSPSSDSTP